MKDKSPTLIKNIYYMLSYAFQVLRHSNYAEVAAEEFNNVPDLYAAILAAGIGQQLKQGLYRVYASCSENLSVVRGRIDIRRTIENKFQRKPQVFCHYDVLTEDNVFNQILKTTTAILLKSKFVDEKRADSLRRLAPYFQGIDNLDPNDIRWNTIRYERNNQSYEMLLNICYFTLKGLLLTTEKGTYKVREFLDDLSMSRLFEKFVLEYYRYHHPELQAAPRQVQWDTDRKTASLLPIMKTDITLKHGEKTLIIDTKYYSQVMKVHSLYGTTSLHSANLYQIYAYVKNVDPGNTGNISGMLLYAKTDERIAPDLEAIIGGNRIAVKTLDLNLPFSEIEHQLDSIAFASFPKYASALS